MFESREDAGRQLALFLRSQAIDADLVLGLPRGGVVVAAEVSRALNCPLGVLVVRKIGHPYHREFAVGAIAEAGVVLLDEHASGLSAWRAELDEVVREEQARLRDYQQKFHEGTATDPRGKAALIIDDGLATGATTEAAVLSARKQGARRITVAAPVASTNAVERLRNQADTIRVLIADPAFEAVGQYYESFPQTTDEEVIELLHSHAGRTA
ncbi:MAG TPA: phosphoribosyltransferase family protein [Verrucomicrobiae bacterium]|nr:phosphoribosyltransferase family protein [Verrucomicrobiae bacterium]